MADLDRSISQFPEASALDPSDLLFLSAEDLSAASGYQSKYINAGTIAQNILSSFEFPLLLNTTAKNVIGALNEFKAGGAVVLTGTATPSASAGVDGNVYIKYSTSGNVTTITNMYVKISGAWEEVATGGGGGSSTLAGLTDVDLTSPTDGQVLSYDGTNNKWVNASGGGGGSASRKVYVGTCDTAAGTAQKEITIPSTQGFTLEVGAIIEIKFSTTSSAGNVTLSVNGTTAYPIFYGSGVYTTSWSIVTGRAGYYTTYVFDGNYWVWLAHGNYPSYSNMTQAEAEAGTVQTGRLVPPTILKQAIYYHAPSAVRTELTQAQYDTLTEAEKNNGTIYFITDAPSNPVDYSTSEKVIGHWVDGSALYEQTFYFDFSDIVGGTQSQSVINGRFDLPHINYSDMWIESAFLINDVPDAAFTIKSMPMPISAASGAYTRIQIQKTSSNEGYPFIYIDVNYNTSAIYDKRDDIHFVFVVRYTK